MALDGSVTQWIGLLRTGNPAAAQPLWERYFRRLVGLARTRLKGMPRRAADEEDVALSAFDSFCRGAERGHFPQLDDRDDLWQLLVLLTARKAIRLYHHERRAKRGGGQVQGESALEGTDEAPGSGLTEFASDEPTPEFAAQVAEQCQRLLDRLPEDDLRSVALWKMEGYTNEEIAERLGCVVRTVERKLRVIRGVWEQDNVS